MAAVFDLIEAGPCALSGCQDAKSMLCCSAAGGRRKHVHKVRTYLPIKYPNNNSQLRAESSIRKLTTAAMFSARLLFPCNLCPIRDCRIWMPTVAHWPSQELSMSSTGRLIYSVPSSRPTGLPADPPSSTVANARSFEGNGVVPAGLGPLTLAGAPQGARSQRFRRKVPEALQSVLQYGTAVTYNKRGGGAG